MKGKREGIPPVAADLGTDVCKVRFGLGSGNKGAGVDEYLGREFVDGREHVSQRSKGTGGFSKVFFGAGDLGRRGSKGESDVGS